MKKDERILKKIEENEELSAALSKMPRYGAEDFLRDGKKYIKAVKEEKMFCIIDRVSNTGMSRELHFHSWNDTHYTNYFGLFKALGYKKVPDTDAFRIKGTGMDMVFATNNSIIHRLCYLGFISKRKAEWLSIKTLTTYITCYNG